MPIHSSSIIDSSAKIHDSVEIGPFCTIGADVEIEAGTVLKSHVVVKGPSKIGPHNTFFQFCTIGEDTPDKKYKDERTELIIGSDNIFREGVTVHRGTIQDKGLTKIGDNNLLMAYAHVAHDCEVGDYNVFANNSGIAGHVFVGNKVTIGALTTIHQFCQMGDYSFAGMNSSITMDVPAFVKVASNPARVVGLNTIGMDRGGISKDTIQKLKDAYRLVYRKSLSIEEAIKAIEAMDLSGNNELNTFLNSIKSSKRGILR